MIRRISVFTAVLCLLLTVPAWSQEAPRGPAGLQTLTGDLADMKWREVSKGVWQATDAEGTTLSYASGQAGMKWALSELKTELVEMSAAVAEEPSNQKLVDLGVLLGTINELKAGLKGAAFGETTDISKAALAKCLFSFSASANASPMIPGAGAWADSSWQSSSCLGTAYARSTSTVTTNGVTLNATDSCSQTNFSALCDTQTTIFGDGVCYSSGYAYVYSSAAGLFFSRWKENCSCGYFGPFC